jgi:23S rRNA (pseudouridine1915-N3)-methyltransferase
MAEAPHQCQSFTFFRRVAVKLTIVAIGHKMPAWVDAGFEEYAKRMPPESRVELIELKPEVRASGGVTKILEQEAIRINAAVPGQAERIVLDERGVPLTTTLLAAWLKTWMAEGIRPCFIIGSADGLAPGVKKSAKKLVALSGCTLPHGMVRVILAEQLYRAWSLMHNHPYHRE